jgi:hypothetical protein
VIARYVDIDGTVDHHCLSLLFIIQTQGLGASEKKQKNYIILQGGELTCFHFLSRRVKLIVTSERLNIFKKKISFPKRSQLLV